MSKEIKPGVYTDLTNEEYHGHKESISRSAMMDFAKSPFTYWAKHLNPLRPLKEATPQMQLGSAFHALILEPHVFEKEYFIMPERVLLKNVGREAYDEYKKTEEEAKNCKDKVVLSRDDYLVLLEMQSRFQLNKEAVELIRDSRIENSFFWIDKDSELLLKARPDILHENMIVDLKTCADASPKAFQNTMVSGGYHIQGAMIRDAVEATEGRRINHVINICIETKYPYNMAIYIIDEFAIDAGQEKYKQICIDLKNARETNSFNDYGIQTISLPKWAI